MNAYPFKLVTIITEAALEKNLINDIEQLGVKGYTVTDARGKGSAGTRHGGWDASANIRLETICDVQIAKNIAEHLQKKYYDNYAMVLFTSDIEVLRPGKF